MAEELTAEQKAAHEALAAANRKKDFGEHLDKLEVRVKALCREAAEIEKEFAALKSAKITEESLAKVDALSIRICGLMRN